MHTHITFTDGYYIYHSIPNDQFLVLRYCDGCGMNFNGEIFPLSIQGEFRDHVLYCTICMSKLLPVDLEK